MEQKIYLGNGKKMNDTWRKSSLCLSDIPKEHIFEYKGKKYVKLNINDKAEVDQFGKDVTIQLDTYKPEKKEGETDDLPF